VLFLALWSPAHFHDIARLTPIVKLIPLPIPPSIVIHPFGSVPILFVLKAFFTFHGIAWVTAGTNGMDDGGLLRDDPPFFS
jgi:hypothetical protein